MPETQPVTTAADAIAVRPKESVPTVEQLIALFRRNLMRGSTVPDSFTGVPQEMRPALDLTLIVPDEQYEVLITRFATMVHEILSNDRALYVTGLHREALEGSAQMQSAVRIQLERPRTIEGYWMQQLWLSELTIYDDAFRGEVTSERIDVQIRNQIERLMNDFEVLARTDTARAAEQKPIMLKELQVLMNTVIERTQLLFQMSNASAHVVRPLIGFSMERTITGYQIYPIYVSQQRQQITDRTTPLLRVDNSSVSSFVSQKEYEQSELGKLLLQITARDWPSLWNR